MNEVPEQAEFGLLIAFLATHGLTNGVARSVIGNNPDGRTRLEIADELRLWLRDRPKG